MKENHEVRFTTSVQKCIENKKGKILHENIVASLNYFQQPSVIN